MIPTDNDHRKELNQIKSKIETVGTFVLVMQFLSIILSIISLPMLWLGIIEPTIMVRAFAIFVALLITCAMSIAAALSWIKGEIRRSLWSIIASLTLIIVFIGSIFLKEILLRS